MWIHPNTIVKLYRDVPLDNSYEDTIYFDSLSAQTTYFHSTLSPRYTFDKVSYQRVRDGVMRMQVLADNIYDCNYMAFRNTSHGNKWFYAFITGVEYINEKVSEITYELDLMQTYFFDLELGECFVERETQQIDIVGNNIKPEPVSLGEYVFTNYQSIDSKLISAGAGSLTSYYAVVGVTDVEEETVEGTMYDNIYSGNTLYAFNLPTEKGDLDNFLATYVQRPDAVNFIYIVPKFALSSANIHNHKIDTTGVAGAKTTINVAQLTGTEEFDSLTHFVPKNKKLYTYPYSFINVDNGSGQNLPLRSEFFTHNAGNNAQLRIEATLTPPVTVTLRPCAYKGTASASGLTLAQPLMTETLTLDSYPQCSWNTDAYKAWLSQNSIPILLDGANLVGNMVADSYQPFHRPTKWGPSIQSQRMSRNVETAGNIIDFTTDTLKSFYTASIQADISRGKLDNGNVNCAQQEHTFYTSWCHITTNMAQTIDDFFDKYGYTCHRLKKPNRCVREHWTYTKTIGCIVKGKAPSNYLSAIRQIYDNGITFWRNPSEVGNYALNNTEPVFNHN